jgi:hypothetical protein
VSTSADKVRKKPVNSLRRSGKRSRRVTTRPDAAVIPDLEHVFHLKDPELGNQPVLPGFVLVAVAGEDRGRTRRALEVRVTAKSELAGGGAMMISDIDAPDNKQWLERTAQAQGVAMARLVREAVRRMRQQEEVSPEELLRQTSGLWRRGDGLGRRSSGHVPA